MHFSLAGLILLIPAITLPLLEFSIIGLSADNSVLGGSLKLYRDGWQMVALLISWCAILAPGLQLGLTLYLCWQLRQKSVSRAVALALKWLNTSMNWSMVEIYLLGIFLAWTKMIDLGQVQVLAGSWCLAGMLICCLVSRQSFDFESAWRYWHQHNAKGQMAIAEGSTVQP